jgi:hypothetical protein
LVVRFDDLLPVFEPLFMLVQVEKLGKKRCKPGERRSKEGLYENARGLIVCKAGSIIRVKSPPLAAYLFSDSEIK